MPITDITKHPLKKQTQDQLIRNDNTTTKEEEEEEAQSCTSLVLQISNRIRITDYTRHDQLLNLIKRRRRKKKKTFLFHKSNIPTDKSEVMGILVRSTTDKNQVMPRPHGLYYEPY